MSSRQSNNQGSGIFFLILLVVGLLYISGNKSAGDISTPKDTHQNTTQTSTTNETKDTQTKPDDGQDAKISPAPKLLVLRNTGASKQLVILHEGKEEVIFTDADEDNKILNVIGLDNSGFAYALVGSSYDTPEGKLAKISTDKTGKLTLVGQDSYMGMPSISANGKDVLEVRFDNSEASFGFNLIKKTNSQETTIDKDEKGINYPAFSKSGKIAYIKGQSGSGTTKLMIYSGTKQEAHTFAASEVVTNLEWLGEDKLIIAMEKFENNASNKGNVKIFNTATKKLEDLVDASGKERYIKTSANGWVAMISGEITSGEDLSGTVTIFNTKDLKQKKIIKAEGVVGWLN